MKHDTEYTVWILWVSSTTLRYILLAYILLELNKLPGAPAMNVKLAICASAPVKPNWVTSPRFSIDEPSESLSCSPGITPCTSWKQQITVKGITLKLKLSVLISWETWPMRAATWQIHTPNCWKLIFEFLTNLSYSCYWQKNWLKCVILC